MFKFYSSWLSFGSLCFSKNVPFNLSCQINWHSLIIILMFPYFLMSVEYIVISSHSFLIQVFFSWLVWLAICPVYWYFPEIAFGLWVFSLILFFMSFIFVSLLVLSICLCLIHYLFTSVLRGKLGSYISDLSS